MTRALVVRADGGAGIGAGHVMRSLALVDAWTTAGGSAEWFSLPLPPMLADTVASRGIPRRHLHDADDWSPLLAWTQAHPDGWVLIDGYGFSSGHVRLRAAGARVLVVDDDGRWPRYECDIVLNQNITADRVHYDTLPTTRLLLGSDFVLLRREFRERRAPVRDFSRRARRLLVSFGGDDSRQVTARVARVLTEAHVDLDIDVTAGIVAGNDPPPALPRLTWHSGTNTASLMRDADIALVAAGSVCWELAYMGVPMLTTAVADNQRALSLGLHERGAARHLGWYGDVSDAEIVEAVDRLCRDNAAREAMSARGRALVDGLGADRVVKEMCALPATAARS